MQRVFIADGEFSKELGRSRANGYKAITIDENVAPLEPCAFESDGTSLVVKPAEATEDKEIYTILCKEFGLVGVNQGYYAKVSVIFCDDGQMLVTLHDGCLIMRYNDSLVMPNVNTDKVPLVDESDICWINAEELLGYSKYLRTKGMFMYDFEFMFRIAGGKSGACNALKFLHIEEETIDISLGCYADYISREQSRLEAVKAKRLKDQLIGRASGGYSYDFDDDDDDMSSDDDDDSDPAMYGL